MRVRLQSAPIRGSSPTTAQMGHRLSQRQAFEPGSSSRQLG